MSVNFYFEVMKDAELECYIRVLYINPLRNLDYSSLVGQLGS
jgi:hypothetical protein